MRAERTFLGRTNQLREIGRFVLQGAAAAGFDERAQHHIELSCDEACSNIIDHTYANRDDGTIDVAWEVRARDFRITLHDSGDPFNLTNSFSTPIPSTDTTPENVQIGGLGLHLIHKLMDDVRYDRIGNQNRLTLMKWRPPDKSIVVRDTLDGIPVVRVFGRLAAELTGELEAVLNELVSAEASSPQSKGLGQISADLPKELESVLSAPAPSPQIIVDLSKTTYCNSAGLRVLVTAWRTAHQNDGDVVLANLNERVREIFEMVGFDKIFRVFETLEEARTWFEKT